MNIKSKTTLADFNVHVKSKLTVLWTSVTFLFIYGDYFELYVPGKIAGILDGDSMLDNPVKLFLASLLLAIPALMICLSILLKPILNRWLNIVSGIIFTAIMVLIAVISISEWRAFYVFYAILESVLTAVIVWTAFKWPMQTNL